MGIWFVALVACYSLLLIKSWFSYCELCDYYRLMRDEYGKEPNRLKTVEWPVVRARLSRGKGSLIVGGFRSGGIGMVYWCEKELRSKYSILRAKRNCELYLTNPPYYYGNFAVLRARFGFKIPVRILPMRRNGR